MSEEEPPPKRRLDPDRAAAAAARKGRPAPQVPAVDTRRYQRLIGLFGLVLVVVVSIAFLTSHRAGTAGIPAGDKLHFFSAPLATSTLNGDANLRPPCTLAAHDPRALNICLMSGRSPLVLAFFVTRSAGCQRQVNALQALRGRYSARAVQFAAVAVRASHQQARAAVNASAITITEASNRCFNYLVTAQAALAAYHAGLLTQGSGVAYTFQPGRGISQICYAEPIEVELDAAGVLALISQYPLGWPTTLKIGFHARAERGHALHEPATGDDIPTTTTVRIRRDGDRRGCHRARRQGESRPRSAKGRLRAARGRRPPADRRRRVRGRAR